jgi:tetratricopeptide (TPR) repeat protein
LTIIIHRGDSDLGYAKADTAYNLGRWRDALISYKMAVRINPKNFYALFDLAETLLEYGYHKESLKTYNKCIDLKADWADAYYGKAKVLFLMKKHHDAIEALKRSFKLDSTKRKLFEEEFPGVRSLKEFTHLLEK